MNFLVEPRDDFADGAVFPGNASYSNLIHCLFQVYLKLMKLLAVMYVVVSKFVAHSVKLGLASSHNFGFLLPKCLDGSVKAHAFFLQLPMIHR
jgi:hypothetical protein